MITILAKVLLSGVTVTLPVEARVQGTEIELGEVAQVAGLDGELVARVRALELGYAPAPGFSRLLTADRIQQLLQRELPGLSICVAGERACRVWPEIEEIQPAEIEAAARAELARAFAQREAAFTLEQFVPLVKIPLGRQGHALQARVPASELSSGVLGVPVEILVDGVRYRTVWTSWRVEVWETRQVLARPVRAGEELAPAFFERARVRVTSDARPAPLVPAQVLGSVAKRDLARGEAVTALDVHRPAAVTLGSTLFLRVKKGAIEARVPALALETGLVGDRIRVRTTESGQELSATVTGRDQCELVIGQ
jgi:flagella basal body P-ring formation protein FlgA